MSQLMLVSSIVFCEVLWKRVDILEAVNSYLESIGPLKIATMCSGSDCPILCAIALLDTFNEQARLRSLIVSPHTLAHCFSVEKNPAKRDFIQRLYPNLCHLFKTVEEVTQAQAYCTKVEAMIEVPNPRILLAFFPCTDVSRLNQKRKFHRGVISDGALSTGGVFGSILRFA